MNLFNHQVKIISGIFILIMVTMFSCMETEDKPNIPDGYISVDSLTQDVKDLFIQRGLLTREVMQLGDRLTQNRVDLDSAHTMYYIGYFELHKVTNRDEDYKEMVKDSKHEIISFMLPISQEFFNVSTDGMSITSDTDIGFPFNVESYDLVHYNLILKSRKMIINKN